MKCLEGILAAVIHSCGFVSSNCKYCTFSFVLPLVLERVIYVAMVAVSRSVTSCQKTFFNPSNTLTTRLLSPKSMVYFVCFKVSYF